MTKGFLFVVFAVFPIGWSEAQAATPFLAAPEFPTNPQPWGTVVADFNHDGHPDVAMANYDTPGYATVLLGNGHGSFSFCSSPAVNKAANGIDAGDFDGDGHIDLVVSSISNEQHDIVTVLRGRGDGTFDAGVEYAVGALPSVVVARDVNGDGFPDLLAANTNSNSVSVLLGTGDGTFQAAVDYGLGVSPLNLALGDMDGDGIADIVVAANSTFATFAVLPGAGDGTFGPPQYGGAGGVLAFGLALADFNRDGRLDIALHDGPGAAISVYLAQGEGLYANVVQTPTDTTEGYSLAAADLYGDGHIELVAAGGSGVQLFEAREDGSLRNAGTMPGMGGGADVVLADINGDGRLDVIAPDYSGIASTALLNQTLFRGGFD